MVPIAKMFQFVLSSALDGHRTLFTGYNALLCSLGRSTEDLVDQGLRQRGRCSRDGVGSVVQQRESTIRYAWERITEPSQKRQHPS